jgi:hypothetical protein
MVTLRNPNATNPTIIQNKKNKLKAGNNIHHLRLFPKALIHLLTNRPLQILPYYKNHKTKSSSLIFLRFLNLSQSLHSH